MKPKIKLDTDQQQALLDSLAMISLAFWGPTPNSCEWILDDQYLKSLEILSDVTDESFQQEIRALRSYLKQFNSSPDLQELLDETYIRLFVSHKEGITAPLYHSCYGLEGDKFGEPLMGEPALKMTEFLSEVGMNLDESITEPPDHLAIELEYLYYRLQQWQSTAMKDHLNKAVSFEKTFLRPWVTTFDRRLSAEKNSSYYSILISVLLGILDLVGQLAE
jgi:putative dimethyl sulfoxide reductase chaperone